MNDDNSRVMVFCAAENLTHSMKATDISFPHQVELKCNDSEVKANLKGLKNKPGSTRPADITSLLRKKVPNYSNIIEMVYALTTKVIPFPAFHSSVCPISKQDPHAYRKNLRHRDFTWSSIWFKRDQSINLSPN